MHLATFKSITVAWVLTQSAAFVANVIFHTEGHFPKMTIALFALGLGLAAIAGFGIGVVAYVTLQAISRANRGFQKAEFLSPWQLLMMATVSIVGGTFALSSLNAVYEDGNVILFVLMASLSTVAFMRSVRATQPNSA